MLTLSQYTKEMPSAKYLNLNDNGQFDFSTVNVDSAQIETILEGNYELVDENLKLTYACDGETKTVLLTNADNQFHADNDVVDTHFSGTWETCDTEDEKETEPLSAASFSIDSLSVTSLSNISVSLCNWMSALPSSLRLTQLSIPGTHDSCTHKIIFPEIAQTQSYDISTQLNSGIRYLDFRIGHSWTTTELELFHGAAKCHMTFRKGLEIITNFLNNHPSETVFLSIQKETHETGDFVREYFDVINSFDQFIYDKNDLPLLGDARGKIILLPSSPEIGSKGINISGLKGNEAWTSTKVGNVTVCANTSYCVLNWKYNYKDRAKEKIKLITNFLNGQNREATTLDINNWNHQWTPGVPIYNYARFINNSMAADSHYFNNSVHHGIQAMDYYNITDFQRIIRNNFQFIK